MQGSWVFLPSEPAVFVVELIVDPLRSELTLLMEPVEQQIMAGPALRESALEKIKSLMLFEPEDWRDLEKIRMKVAKLEHFDDEQLAIYFDPCS